MKTSTGSLLPLAPLAVVGSALLYALSGPPFDLPLLAWLALAPLLFVLRRSDPLRAGLLGAVWGLIAFASVFYGAIGYGVALTTCVVVLGAALFAGFACLVRLPLRSDRLWLRILGPPSLWGAVEWVCTHPPFDLPAALGVILVDSPAAQVAAFTGGIGLSFLVMGSAAAIAEFASPENPAPGRRRLALAAGGLAPCLLAVSVGALMPGPGAGDGPTIHYRGIQPAIPFDRTNDSWWRPDLRAEIRNTFETAVRAASSSRARLVLWPEGGAMLSRFDPATTRRWLPELSSGDRTYLISTSDLTTTGVRRNRVLAFEDEGAPLVYQKSRLIPLAEDAYEAGRTEPVLRTRAGAVGSMICFEVCFPDTARRLVDAGAELLFVSTNDAAFGDTALPLWHRAAARLRAIENSRPLLFVSNRGPSSHFDPRGRIVSELAMGQPGVLEGSLEIGGAASFYSRHAGFVAWIWPLLGAICLVAARHSSSSQLTDAYGRSARGWIAASLAGLGAAAVLIGGGQQLVRSPPGSAPAFAGTSHAELDAFRQERANTCGVAALAYLATTLGEPVSQSAIEAIVDLQPSGTTLLDLRDAGRRLGYSATGRKWDYARLEGAQVPVIAHLSDLHYVVVLAARGTQVMLFDPNGGLEVRPRSSFLSQWSGYVLELLPGEAERVATGSNARRVRAPIGGRS